MSQRDTRTNLPSIWRDRALLSIAETAEATGLSRALLYRLISSGSLNSVKIGKRRGVRPCEIEAFLDRAEAQ